MAQKYKCNRCGSIFSADGQGDVRCPQCGTEDIVVVTDGSSNKKIIIAVLIFIILAAGGLVAYKLLSDNGTKTDEPKIALNNVEFTDMGESMPVTIDTDSASYTFKVFAILSEQISEPVYYSISLADGTVKTSNDGLFRNVPPSREYTYIVRANVKGRDDIKEATLEVTGFYPIEKESDVKNPAVPGDTSEIPGEPVKPRVTVQQVQQWVNNLPSEQSTSMLVKTRGNNLVQQPVQWAFTNLRSGESKPQNASVVMEKLDSEWTSLTVVSITTSPSNGMLTSLTCKINYREE